MTDPETSALPPLRLGPSALAVVVGGAIGTLIRAVILAHTSLKYGWVGYAPLTNSFSHPTWTHFIPWTLVAINTIGVFCASVLLSGPLRDRSPDDWMRLLVITGFLGGLTSYSSLIRDLAIIRTSSLVGAAITLVGALLAGIVAAVVGSRIVRR